jgi:hypothetical protein
MLRRHSFTGLLSITVGLLVFGTSGVAQKGTSGRPSATAAYQQRQTRPIKLGTSGGNAGDLANGYCCSGTLGALVQKDGQQYILSNTHVFAGDSAPGGNGTVSQVGDAVNQPGLIDVGCQNIASDYVATVSDFAQFSSSDNVDAAIAQVIGGAVDSTGAIVGIGTLSGATVSPSLGQTVKKSGRTTGTTRSSISGLNATINVGYSDECAGASFTKQFTGQVVINNRGSKFLAGGDSGSLMVEDVATSPRAVGLLYAGSNSIAVANPIDDVLNRFGVTMVGAAGAGSTAGSIQGGGTVNAAAAQGIARAIQVQQLHGQELLDVPGAVGHAVGLSNGAVIKILVEEITPAALAAAPRQVDGVTVVLEAVGQVRGLTCARRK